MRLEKLKKITNKKLRKLGRGPGTGRGKTSGRGQKGQNARHKLSIAHSHFEGGQRPLIKRLPYQRGKGNSKISKKPQGINLKDLNNFPKNLEVNIENLIKNKIISAKTAKKHGVKILSIGDISYPLTVNLPISSSARAKIEKAKGKVIYSQK